MVVAILLLVAGVVVYGWYKVPAVKAWIQKALGQ